MTTAAAVRAAAKMPQACESSRTPRMRTSIGASTLPEGRAGRHRPQVGDGLLHGKRRVDQLLAVGDLARELLVGALLRDLDPGIVLLGCEGRDLDVVLLEGLDHLLVELLRFLVEVLLRLLACVAQHLLLLLVELVEA